MTAVVLVHSPLVGPATWAALAPELRARGLSVAAPDIAVDGAEARPLWREHARRAAAAVAALPPNEPPLLVGHSGAGALLPAIREMAGRSVSGYVFVDAGLPDASRPRKGTGAFAERLATLHRSGHRFPEWTDEDLRGVVPDADRRRALLAELRPAPPAFWDEIIPVSSGWPDAPCAYLRFVPNPSYDEPAAEARARGWGHLDMPGAHFHMLVDPRGVADALLALAGAMRHVAVNG